MKVAPPRTGIELRARFGPTAEAFGKVLSALHLKKLGDAAADATHLLVSFDGVESEVVQPGPHFIPCAPGDHTLSVATKGFMPLASVIDPVLTRDTKKVIVTEGRVTFVRYVIGTPDLEVLDSELPPI
jgi:hypothetical protein